MSMTKKDFEALAMALRPVGPQLTDSVKARLVAFCAGANPLFKAQRWLDALEGKTTRKPAAKNEALALADEIAEFERACEDESYTDTGRAWELLADAEALLRQGAR